ncbi:hypothetical protein OIDMADRAFT_19608 [Oidiodendron maius Zn]|uniref:Uncharacterized protein n=1 Tax=Oidiodendron maius (strain Zn) TaxID=913774 RepID=A0A0C3HBY6_OIDMZ|nr:hypothetical protein OIDMADRAFT_19608 [Oidiodendron maius Zn]
MPRWLLSHLAVATMQSRLPLRSSQIIPKTCLRQYGNTTLCVAAPPRQLSHLRSRMRDDEDGRS